MESGIGRECRSCLLIGTRGGSLSDSDTTLDTSFTPGMVRLGSPSRGAAVELLLFVPEVSQSRECTGRYVIGFRSALVWRLRQPLFCLTLSGSVLECTGYVAALLWAEE